MSTKVEIQGSNSVTTDLFTPVNLLNLTCDNWFVFCLFSQPSARNSLLAVSLFCFHCIVTHHMEKSPHGVILGDLTNCSFDVLMVSN